MSKPTSHSIPVELRLNIYQYILRRPYHLVGNVRGLSKFATLKEALLHFDTGLLGVSKKIYSEAIDCFLRDSEFEWPLQAISDYPERQRRRLDRIRHICLDFDGLNDHRRACAPGSEAEYVTRAFPSSLRHVEVHIHTRKFRWYEVPDTTNPQLRSNFEKCESLLREFQKREIRLVFYRHGSTFPALDAAIETRYPGLLVDQTDEVILRENGIED